MPAILICLSSLQCSSLAEDPLASNLAIDLLPGPSAAAAQLAALQAARERPGSAAALAALPRARAAAPLLVPPARLDALDCVLLRYSLSWPLSAVLTDDSLVGYAAVFTAMLRVRRVAAALRRLRGTLALRARGRGGGGAAAAALLAAGLDDPQGEAAQRRLQRLRAFAFAATQFAAAVHSFQAAATSGPAWERLLEKLGTSSDEAAAEVAAAQLAGAGGGGGARQGAARQQAQQAQQLQGLADLQELLDLHRAYVTSSAESCLTFCGRAAAREAAEAGLQAALEVAARVEAAAAAAAGQRGEGAWARALAADAAWAPLAAGIAAFDSAARRLAAHVAQEGGAAGPLGQLAARLAAWAPAEA
jgi:hypothetical protein